MSDRVVDDLAAALVDGERVDWSSARAQLRSPRDQSVVHALESLSHISAPELDSRDHLYRGLPWFLESFRWLAIVCCVIGLAGFAVTGPGARPVRTAIMAAILIVFGSVAVYLDAGGRDRRARVLAACFWMTAASFSARGILELARMWPASYVLRGVAALRPEAMLAAAFWQFARDFPAKSTFSRVDRLCDLASRIAVGIGAALFVANLVPFVWPGSVLANAVRPLDRIAGDGPIFWDLVFGMGMLSLFMIGARARGVTGAERARVRLFLYSVTFAFAPIMVQVFVEGLFPGYMKLMRTPRGLFWSGLAVYPPMFALPVATAYAVAAADVLRVRVVVHQGLRYLLTRWLLMWGATVPIVALAVHLYRHAERPLAETLATPPAPALLWFAAVGTLMLACRNVLIRWLDRWALAGMEAPSVALAIMTDRMKETRTASEVATVLAENAERAMQAGATAYVTIDGALVPTVAGTRPPEHSVISVLLQGAREPCVVAPAHRQSYHSLMTEADRQWIERDGVHVLVPIFSARAGNTLFGMVALKGRRNALAYSPDDLRFLQTAAASANLACDAIAYDSQRERSDTEELARQCTQCWRVDAWTSERGSCECGGAWERAALPKMVLSRFEILQRLGAGGMGVVYRATDLTLGREVAVKTLPLLSEDAATRLTAEARTMAALPHSDIAVLFGAEKWRGTPLLIMEYLAGGTLAARIRQGALAPSDACIVVRRLTTVLERLHEAGLYHGDIKPSNIGFQTDGVPKLLDFGLARAASGADAPLGGTFAYLSPEVRAGAPADRQLDLWALSVVLCETLLGRHPFPLARSDKQMAAGIDAALSTLRPGVSPTLADALTRALSMDVGGRPRSASELGDMLDRE